MKPQHHRSSRSQMLFKIRVPKNFKNRTKERQVIRPATKLERDSKTGALQLNPRNLQECLFYTEHDRWLLLTVTATR